jgi:uncharacterized protein (TIGR03083 family)
MTGGASRQGAGSLIERSRTVDQATAYQRSSERIRSLVNERNADVEIPTCPGWTVKDMIGHLADLIAVYKTDPKEGFSPGWGDRGVEDRSDRSLGENLDEWDELVKDSGDIFDSHMAQVAVSDILAHEQDIRTAIDEPGARDDENIVPSIEMALAWVEQKADGLPTLRLVTESVDRQIGEGDPSVTLRTSNYDLFRVLHGRRTVEQVRAMDWSGDPDPWMKDLFIFGPTERVVES